MGRHCSWHGYTSRHHELDDPRTRSLDLASTDNRIAVHHGLVLGTPLPLLQQKDGLMDPMITTEDAKVAEIIVALYPILYPIEQQDLKIQEMHRSIVTNLAIALWRAFAGTPHP